MHVTFRQLSLFVALAQHRSVSSVARAFHVTQPTVSMQLRDLSETVGMPLYEMIGKQIHLTAAGEALAKTAQTMISEWSDYQDWISSMKGLSKGRLRVAMVSTAKYFVPRLLGTFCQKYPDIEIALEIQNRDGVVRRLRENLDDLYVMSTPPKDVETEQRRFLSNPLVIVAPLTHPLSKAKSIRLSKLQNERFILREKGSGTRMACDNFFQKQQFHPVVRLELGSNEAIKQAVAGGLGLSILSRYALAELPENESLVVLKVQGFPIHSHWYTVTLLGKRLTPTAQAFLSFLNTQAEQIEAQL
ncbi:MAG: LysR family transcriptional regulator [Verrucomicrobiota bacterium]